MLKRVIDVLRPWPRHHLDRTLGIETSQRFERWRWRSGHPDLDQQNVGYAGSQPSVIRRAFAALPEIGPSTAFLDIGCGKGRALAVATEFPFREITGVELLPGLVARGQANAAKIAARHPARTRAQVIRGDATRPPLPTQGDLVVYLYNPFSGPLVDQLLDSLEAQLEAFPDLRAFIVYCNPAHGDRVDARPRFRRHFAEKIAFSEEDARCTHFPNTWDSVVIWQAGPAARLAPAHPNADWPIVVKVRNLAAEVRAPEPATSPG